MAKPGRPKKENAVKAGELKTGLIRFSFIADQEKISLIKIVAEKRDCSIKGIMDEAVGDLLKKYDEPKKPQDLLKEYLKRKVVK